MSVASPLTNEYVQDILADAVTNLKVSGTPEHLLVAKVLSKSAKTYASGNSMPAGRGLGLEETVALAEFYAAKDYIETML